MADHDQEAGHPASVPDDFAEHARGGRRGLVSEMWAFFLENKKWWLLPIVITMLGLGVLVVLGGGATPFLYALF